MSQAEHELRALKRELLLTRAAAERAQVVHQLDSLAARTRGPRALLGVARDGADRLRGSSFLSTAAAALGFVRRRPWLAPLIFKGASQLARSGPLGVGLTVGAIALVGWRLARSRKTASASEGADTVARDESSLDTVPVRNESPPFAPPR